MIIRALFDALPEEIESVATDTTRPDSAYAVIGVKLACGRVHQMKARWEDLKAAGVEVPR